MKRILPLFFLMLGMVDLPAYAITTVREVKVQDAKDIHNGYIIEKIPLSNYATPTIAISGVSYTDAQLPTGAKVSSPEKFTVILGMERKHPFAIVRIPAYAQGSTTASVNQVSALTLTIDEDVAVKSNPAAAKLTDAANSVLANGTWYKIGVTQTGFYKIDYNFIKSLGLDPATIHTSDIRIFGNGGNMLSEANYTPRPSDLLENGILVNDGGDNAFNDGDNVIFYAVGPLGWIKDTTNHTFKHQQNLYSDTACYFITFDNGAAGARLNVQNGTPSGNITVTDFDYYNVYEKDLVNPATLGKQWYGEQFNTLAGNLTQNFGLSLGSNIAQLTTRVAFTISGNSASNFSASLNGNNLGSVTFTPSSDGNTVMSETMAEWTTPCNSNTANVSVTFNPVKSDIMGYLDFIEVLGRRQLLMTSDQMNFRDWQSVGTDKVATYQLQGANGNTRVWDVTDPQHPILMNGSLNGSTYQFTCDAQALHEFAAMNSGNLYSPSFIGQVANQNLHSFGQTDCIIVTYKDFLPQANQLADYHRAHDKLRVTVATTEQIYNEFSSGAQDISAIRDFTRMFYKRAGTDTAQMPRYLILFGGASYDYKNRVANNSNFVPVFESQQSYIDLKAFSTDDFFGFLDDNEYIENSGLYNALDIGIGRLPARSTDDATALVNKIIGYKDPSTLGPWRISSMFVADNNDGAGYHMSDAEDMARTIKTSTKNLYNESKVYLDAIPFSSTPAGDRCPIANQAINDNVFRGALVINYNGHGNTEVWADERILSQDDYNKWTNKNSLPFMITATCDFGQFDHPNYVSAAEQMLLRQGGGIISVLTTTAAVFSNFNNELNTSFLDAQFTQNPNGEWNAFGDASRIGKNATYFFDTGSDELANFRKFSLLGDPALTPNFPEHFVYLDSLNDAATMRRTDTINALGAFVLNGSVHDKNGTLLSNFNGLLSVTIYDKPRTIATITKANATFIVQDNIVYKGKVSVTNGMYKVSFIAPKDINYLFGTGKVSTYAQEAVTDGAGVDTSLTVGGYSDHPVLNTVPPVVKAYINDSFFLNGGITGSNTSLFVAVTTETGLNVTGNKLGHDLTAVLDDKIEAPYILNDYYETEPNTYKRGYISFPLTGLENGRHTIKVKVWDVNNNPGEGYVDFVVLDGTVVGIQNLMNYPNPFNNTTHFVFEHNHPDEELNIKINIYNSAGALVKNIDESFTPTGSRSNEITWDGTDNNGARLPSGMYMYRTVIRTEKGYMSTAYQKLVIAR